MVEVIKRGVWHNGKLCAVGATLKLSASDEKRLVAEGWCKSAKKTNEKPKSDSTDKDAENEQAGDAPATDAPDGDA